MLKFPLPSGGSEVDLGGIGVDLTERSNADTERDQLAIAIEQAAESVMITDLEARITYVNPAFERVTGYTRAEVIGQNPRSSCSSGSPGTFSRFTTGDVGFADGRVLWVADFVNRRKDGSLFTEEAVITPIRDASGEVTSYVAVKRDVTRERALLEHASQLVRASGP